MNLESHRSHVSKGFVDDDDEGEIDSNSSDNDEITDSKTDISKSWTAMLTEQNLSSVMSNALADNSKIIHIDDPIAQQSSNPLTYVFPPGTDVDEYFKRKQKHFQHKPPNRRDLKNLSRLLDHEKNQELLRVILNTIGCQRAFQYAQDAIRIFQTDNEEKRTLGGIYFKMFINDTQNQYVNDVEREQIKKQNQQIQKAKKKKNKQTSKLC